MEHSHEKYHKNSLILKDKRRELRRNQTSAEKELWKFLRNRKLNNKKFYRQYSIGNFILDFYCPSVKLGIELDGSQHQEKEIFEYDLERTAILKEQDIVIFRFWNSQVFKDIDLILMKINNFIQKKN